MKINFEKIFLVIFVMTTGVFAWLYFFQEECTLDRFAVQIPTFVSDFPTTTPPFIKDTVPHTAYVKENGKVYYSDLIRRYTQTPDLIEIKDVDFDTFETIDTHTPKEEFAKDKDHIFFAGKIADIDKNTFEEISDFYFKDKNFVYYVERVGISYTLKRVDADVVSFKVFVASGLDSYTLDKNNVYYNGEIIKGVKPDSFGFVSTPEEVSRMGGKGGPDMTKFYIKDSDHIIYRGKIVYGADVKSFSTIYTGGYFQEYGKDKSHVYYQNSLIDDADPNTFVPQSPQIYEGCRKGLYGIDSKGVYFKNFKMIGADPNTFKALINGYGKDSNHVYFDGVIQEALSPDEFQPVCNYG